MLAPQIVLPKSAVIVPAYILVALGEIGVIEDPRVGFSNPQVEKYHAATAGGPAIDDLAWCASFVGWCLQQGGYPSTRSKSASSYVSYGIAQQGFPFGSIAVMGKSDPDAKGTGHVGFVLGASGHDLFMLGGNQGNRVSIALKAQAQVVRVVMPPPLSLVA